MARPKGNKDPEEIEMCFVKDILEECKNDPPIPKKEKFSIEIIDIIVAEKKSGKTYEELGKKYGCSHSYIRKLVRFMDIEEDKIDFK